MWFPKLSNIVTDAFKKVNDKLDLNIDDDSLSLVSDFSDKVSLKKEGFDDGFDDLSLSSDFSDDSFELTEIEFDNFWESLRNPKELAAIPKDFGWLKRETIVKIPKFDLSDLKISIDLDNILNLPSDLDDLSLSTDDSLDDFSDTGEGFTDTGEGSTTLLSDPNAETLEPGAWFDAHDGGPYRPGGTDIHFENGYILDVGYIPEALAVDGDFTGEVSETLEVVDGEILEGDQYVDDPVDSFSILDAEVVEIDETQVYALAEEAAENLESTVDSFTAELNDIWSSLERGEALTPEQIQVINEAFLVRDQIDEVVTRLDSEGFETDGLHERLIEPLDTALENAGVTHMSPFEIEQAESGLEVNGEFSYLESGGTIERGFKVAGKVMLVVGLAEAGYHIITADHPAEAALQEGGGWAGAFAAAEAAESFAAPLIVAAGPFGWAVGGVIGLAAGAAGYWAGSKLGEATYYHFAGEGSEDVAENALQIALLELASVENIDARATFLGHGTGSSN